MPLTKTDLPGDTTLWTLTDRQSSHLVVRNGRSLLVDCHSADLPRLLQAHSLPAPDLILHTHVQPEHCRQADAFPTARIHVHAQLKLLASDPQHYRTASRTTWDKPEEWPQTRGRELYSIAGSITTLPPEKPIRVTDTFAPGDVIHWQGLSFHVIDLPAHGLHAVGFLLKLGDRVLALFTGDLLCDGAHLVNMYDLETHYDGTALPSLPALLRATASLGADLFLPATGPVLPDGPDQARRLADKIDAYQQSLQWTTGRFTPPPQPDYPKVGRYVQVHDGVYQIANAGNCILFIDEQGRGLMVDPGPCDYENPSRNQAFLADLDLFHRQCGLATIERILLTHFHGDHLDMTPLVLDRYPGCRVAAWDLVARVVTSPHDYSYGAMLPWYNLGFDTVPIHDVLDSSTPYAWNDVLIDSDHLPGHCFAHGAYWFTFRGKCFAITGDSIQSRGGSSTLSYIMCNDSVPGDNDGCVAAFRTALKHNPDINLGGHGSHFTSCRDAYEESLRRMEHALPHLRKLFPDGDLDQAFRRPWLPPCSPRNSPPHARPGVCGLERAYPQ